MERHPLGGTFENRSPLVFFLLVFLLSIPIWALGPAAERFLPEELPVDLPISSLMFIAPASVAVILVRREKGAAGVKELLKRAFDLKRIKKKTWYIPMLLIMPAMMALEYGLKQLTQGPLSAPEVPVLIVPVFFAVFFLAAIGEELGWQGYAIDPLQDRWSALAASIVLGTVWAIWHLVPLIQAQRPPAWIASQCMSMVVARILIVWLYNNTGKSVFAAVLFHTMTNLCTVLLPEHGWPYDPFVAVVTLGASAVIVTFLWDPRTLASFRYARPRRPVQSNSDN